MPDYVLSCFHAPTACSGFREPSFSVVPSPVHPVPSAASPSIPRDYYSAVLHKLWSRNNSQVFRQQHKKEKQKTSWVFLRSTFLDVPCRRRFSGSSSYRKPVTSQLHVNTTQLQHEKEQYFSPCHFLLSCSLFTQHFPIMKTADQRNRGFTGLKIQINATLVLYPSSETPLNLSNITTFQRFYYILNINSIVPSPKRQMLWPLTATPTTKNPYILYQPTLFLPFQNYLLSTF